MNTAEFSANSDLTSKQALHNPYDKQVNCFVISCSHMNKTLQVSIGNDFFSFQYLQNVITDAHFYQRDRMGRLVSIFKISFELILVVLSR